MLREIKEKRKEIHRGDINHFPLRLALSLLKWKEEEEMKRENERERKGESDMKKKYTLF